MEIGKRLGEHVDGKRIFWRHAYTNSLSVSPTVHTGAVNTPSLAVWYTVHPVRVNSFSLRIGESGKEEMVKDMTCHFIKG